jgi:hypothetical protein
MDEASATKYALGQGALEGGITALFQAMGFGGAEKLLSGNAKWQGAKAFLLGLAGEVGEENAVSIAQKSLEKIADIDPTDWTVEQLIQLSADTTVQAGLGFGMAQSISSISEFASKPWPSRKAAKDAGLDQIVTTAKERRDLAEKVRNGLTGQQFTEQLRTAATSPEEADALLEIYKARASSAGESFDDYVGKRIKGVEKTTSDKSVYLAQRQSGKPDALAQPAYHGSPHKFDKFTTDAMGTGEGAQAYGWGLYFAGNKAVANYYKQALANKAADKIDWSTVDLPPSLTTEEDHEYHRLRNAILKTASREGGPQLSEQENSRYRQLKDKIDARRDAIEAAKPKGSLYKVDLKPSEDEYLDWDKSLSEQSEKVKELLGYDPLVNEKVNSLYTQLTDLSSRMSQYSSLPDGQFIRSKWDEMAEQKRAIIEKMELLGANVRTTSEGYDVTQANQTGASIYHKLKEQIRDGATMPERLQEMFDSGKLDGKERVDQLASKYLNALGVRGIRYLDGSSRGKGEGHHNYVIFDDADVVIEEVLAQKKGPTPRGEVQFLKDEGTAIIRAFEGQNLSTLLHETGHIFRRDLAGDDLKIAERWAGARGGKWNRKAEEKFARGFENYLATGKAPTTKLAQVFEKFKNWLAGVYGAIKGTAIDVNISPEMRGVFDRLLTPTAVDVKCPNVSPGFGPTSGTNMPRRQRPNSHPRPNPPAAHPACAKLPQTSSPKT